MKVIVLTTEHGNYPDDSYTTVDAAYMVPDDFEVEPDRKAFYLRLRESKDSRIRWRKNGEPYWRDMSKSYDLWRADLVARFGATKMEVVEV